MQTASSVNAAASARLSATLLTTMLLASPIALAADAVQWRVEDGGNGHWYEVVDYGIGQTHGQARVHAAAVGAQLVSIASSAETSFLESLTVPLGAFAAFTLGGYQDLSAPDYGEPGNGWRWRDGTPWSYTNWDCGVCAQEYGSGWWCQPDNYIDQHFLVGVICMGRLVWDDGTAGNAERRAIYEWSADCNNDGLVDYGQILNGTLADANANNIPDSCDCASDTDGDQVPDCLDRCPTEPTRTSPIVYFIDADGDGFGAGAAMESCTAVPGASTNNVDCDDTSAAVFPGAPELCADLAIDNDCDGVIEASDQHPCFIDADGDGYTPREPQFLSCFPCGQPSWIPDCDDSAVLYYDEDGDGFGAGVPAPCGVPAYGDCNDTDSSVFPGASDACNGVDDDCDGLADNTCRDVTLLMAATGATLEPGAAFTVRVAALAAHPLLELIGLQSAIHFDAARLELIGVVPVGPLTQEIAELIDNAAGTVRYAIGVFPRQPGLVDSAPLFDLNFRVRDDAELCTPALELVRFDTVATTGTLFVAMDGTATTPVLVSLPSIDVDQIAPVIEGAPAAVSVAADAGSLLGGTVTQPEVGATDACGPVDVTMAIVLPDGGSGSAWPVDGIFPVGVSTVTWSASDLTGNIATATTVISVGDYQLVDAVFTLAGSFNPSLQPFGRTVRLASGDSVRLLQLDFLSSTASAIAEGVQVPMSGDVPCMTAKDIGFSISDVGSTTIAGRRYSTQFMLKQGDSNDDDTVDILDFGLWFIDRGAATAASRSNFNGDGVVDSGDFAWLSVHFFQVGESCASGYTGQAPVQRISVKELRRRGLGDLEPADLNGDGWLDARDVRRAMDLVSAAPSAEVPPGGRH